MLRSLRAARCGQIVLAVAGFLAITGSFGLHPEPAGTDAMLPGSGMDRWSAISFDSNGSHSCPVCLAHRPVPIAGLVVALLAPPASVRVGEPAGPRALRVSARLPYDGRAPPAGS